MNELVTLRKEFLLGSKHTLSPDEVRALSAMIIRHDALTRWILLDVHDNKGYISIHYQTFDEYCTGELKMNYSRTYYYDLVRAARVERTLFGPQTFDSVISPEFPRTPLKALLALAEIPEAELKSAWKEYTDRKAVGTFSTAQCITQLKKIAASQKNNAEGVTAAAPKRGRKPKSDAPVAPSEAVATPAPVATVAPTRTVAPSAEEVLGITILKEKPPLPRIDWEEAEWIMELAGSWVKARGFGGPKASLCAAAAMLHAIANWIEEGA